MSGVDRPLVARPEDDRVAVELAEEDLRTDVREVAVDPVPIDARRLRERELATMRARLKGPVERERRTEAQRSYSADRGRHLVAVFRAAIEARRSEISSANAPLSDGTAANAASSADAAADRSGCGRVSSTLAIG